jgi:hypothetical protein
LVVRRVGEGTGGRWQDAIHHVQKEQVIWGLDGLNDNVADRHVAMLEMTKPLVMCLILTLTQKE